MNRKLFLMVASLSIFSLVSCEGSTEAKAGEKPVMMYTGAHSKVKTREFIRIRDQKNWDKVWFRHLGKTANDAFNSLENKLQVDFSRYEVIAIFDGEGINARAMMVEEIIDHQEKINIHYDRWSFQTSGGHVDTTVFAFMVIPKTNKVVTLEENKQGLKNHPAKWKIQASLDSGK